MSVQEVASNGSGLHAPRAMPESASAHPVSVLIGEHDPVAARKLEEIVHSYGHIIVDIAYSDADLAGAAFRYRPDLVLTSTQLNGQPTGVTAVLTLREFYNCAAIFTSVEDKGRFVGARPPFGLVISRPYNDPEVALALGSAIAKLSRPSHMPVCNFDDLCCIIESRGDRISLPKFTGMSASRPVAPVPSQNAYFVRSLCTALVAIRRFGFARAHGVGVSFSKKLDKEIGEGLASGIAMLLLAASTPIVAIIFHLRPEFAWIGPVLAVARLLRSRE